MRTGFAVLLGLALWGTLFFIFQLIGFWILGIEPGGFASEAVVGFFSSITAVLLSELIVQKAFPGTNGRLIWIIVAIAIAALYVFFLITGPEPPGGYGPLLAGLVASLVPFVQVVRDRQS